MYGLRHTTVNCGWEDWGHKSQWSYTGGYKFGIFFFFFKLCLHIWLTVIGTIKGWENEFCIVQTVPVQVIQHIFWSSTSCVASTHPTFFSLKRQIYSWERFISQATLCDVSNNTQTQTQPTVLLSRVVGIFGCERQTTSLKAKSATIQNCNVTIAIAFSYQKH